MRKWSYNQVTGKEKGVATRPQSEKIDYQIMKIQPLSNKLPSDLVKSHTINSK